MFAQNQQKKTLFDSNSKGKLQIYLRVSKNVRTYKPKSSLAKAKCNICTMEQKTHHFGALRRWEMPRRHTFVSIF